MINLALIVEPSGFKIKVMRMQHNHKAVLRMISPKCRKRVFSISLKTRLCHRRFLTLIKLSPEMISVFLLNPYFPIWLALEMGLPRSKLGFGGWIVHNFPDLINYTTVLTIDVFIYRRVVNMKNRKSELKLGKLWNNLPSHLALHSRVKIRRCPEEFPHPLAVEIDIGRT